MVTKTIKGTSKEDELLRMLESRIDLSTNNEVVEEISANSIQSISPVYTNIVDIAKAGIENETIMELYTSQKTPQELRQLLMIDGYCSLFDSEKRVDVVRAIEEKLKKNEKLEDVTKYAALELAKKISSKDKKKLVNSLLKELKSLTEDYKKIKDEKVKEALKKEFPQLEKIVQAKEQITEEQKKKIDTMNYGLQGLILKEYYDDFANKLGKFGNGAKEVAEGLVLGFVGLLPQHISYRLITKAIQKGIIKEERNYNDENNLYKTAFDISGVIEIITPIIASVSLSIACHNPNYLFGLILVMPAAASMSQRDENSDRWRNKYPGSLLFCAPYHVAKATYIAAKWTFYSMPKKIIDSSLGYHNELKKRALEKYEKNQGLNKKL